MNNMFLVTCFIFFFINIFLPFCQATHPLCNKWNTILETALTPTLNTTYCIAKNIYYGCLVYTTFH